MNRKQRILIVHNYYQISGGEDTVVTNEKKLLEDNGHKVFLYTRHNSELKDYSVLPKLGLIFTTIFNLRTYKEVKRLIKEKQIDIVHVHNTLSLVSPSVYYAAINCSVPVVQTIHNFRLLCPAATLYRDGHICEDCIEYGLKCAVKYRCYRNSRFQTLAVVMCTEVHRFLGTYKKLNYICLTEFNRQKLLKLKQIERKKTYVKPNFVKAEEDVIPYEKRKNRYVFAGRLDRLKGVEVLLKAWNSMSGEAPKLTICGTGPMEMWCREYIAANNLVKVEVLGKIPNTEVREIIADSRALLLPTLLYEGFPMTIAEAYSVGTPVIGSDLGNTGDLIQDGLTGYKFPPESMEGLVQSVIEMHDMVDTTISFYNTYLSEQKNYNALIEIYSSLCEN